MPPPRIAPGTARSSVLGPIGQGEGSVLVTGGTGGIGKTTAIGLAALGARVGITGRDPARAEAAAASIRAASAVTSRAVTFRGNGQPGRGGAAALPPGRIVRACRDGMKARSRRRSNYVAQDAWRATCNGEVRYALFRWRDLLVWECWPGQGAARALCTARVA